MGAGVRQPLGAAVNGHLSGVVPYTCDYVGMKRITAFLPDELYERLRQEAFTARVSMAQVIRRRLESGGRRRKAACADPLAKVEGIVSDGHLTEGIDESLYSS